MDGYLTVIEVAEKWGITRRRVQKMCSDGMIPGVVRFGKAWAIPEDVVRPSDGRIKTGEYIGWRKREK